MRRIADALSGIRSLGFDSDCIIYFVDPNPDFEQKMITIFQAITSGQLRGQTSTLTLTEGMVGPLRKGDTETAQRYRDLLLNSFDFQVLPIDAAIAERAAELRVRYNMRTPDAVQAASAIHSGCDAFLTNNGSHFRRITELQILVLDELTL